MREKYTQEEIIEQMRDDIKVELISAEVTDQKKRRLSPKPKSLNSKSNQKPNHELWISVNKTFKTCSAG